MSFMEPAMRYASFPLMRLDKAFGIPGQHGLELLLGVLIQITGGADGVHHGSPGGIVVQILVQALLVLCHIRHLDVDKVVMDSGVQDGDLLCQGALKGRTPNAWLVP